MDLHPEHFAKRVKTGNWPDPEKKGQTKYGARQGRFKVAPGDWFCPACGNHNRARRLVCFAEDCEQEKVEPGRKQASKGDRGKGTSKVEQQVADDVDSDNESSDESSDEDGGGDDSEGDSDSGSDSGSNSGSDSGSDNGSDEHIDKKDASDWRCSACGNLNWACRAVCNSKTCSERRPVATPKAVEKKATWSCPKCKTRNEGLKCVKEGCSVQKLRPRLVFDGRREKKNAAKAMKRKSEEKKRSTMRETSDGEKMGGGWAIAVASDDHIEANMKLREAFLSGRAGDLSEDDQKRAKILIARSERKKARKEAHRRARVERTSRKQSGRNGGGAQRVPAASEFAPAVMG